MTDTSRGHGGLAGPPWSVDVLADLHAGVLDPQVAAELWPQANADPEARAVLDALDATQAELSNFSAAPAPPMPADVAARIDAALANEAAQRAGATPRHAPVASLAEARHRRQRRLAGWGGGILATAAAAVAVTLAVGPTNTTVGNGVAAPTTQQDGAPDDTGPMALSRESLGKQYSAAMGAKDYGPLDNPRKLATCLQANGVDPGTDAIGVREVTLDGKQGVLIILPGGKAIGQFRLLVVSPECGPGNPGMMADTSVGG
ncbi:MAG: hypothetical protein GEU98_08010 [Pseudonocardiaceae bacterium]|nr:hypothetical protein [Pseudonocardiaceae bacterium]